MNDDNSRLIHLIRSGHGDCWEAIKLEPNKLIQIEKLRHYIATRPNGTQLRRARRKLMELTQHE